MRKIVILQKSSISSYPPLLTFINIVRKYVEVVLICGNELPENKEKYASLCSEYYCLDIPDATNGFVSKVKTYLRVRRTFWNFIYQKNLQNELLWIFTADTAIALGDKLLKHKFILGLYELFDTFPIYQKHLKRYAPYAKMIICAEENRANILRVWWKLNKTPKIVPNKVVGIERTRNLPLTPELEKLLNTCENKKIVLYQGLITSDRNLDVLCKTISEQKEYQLILMGKNTAYLNRLIKENPSLIYIPFVSPPYHLHVTSHAHIGVLSYDYSSLNNIFCAPNKVWEYSAYGIPMLGNNIPGLNSVIRQFRTGATVDMSDNMAIKRGLEMIECEYETYSKNSYNFYSSIDLEGLWLSILNEVAVWIPD